MGPPERAAVAAVVGLGRALRARGVACGVDEELVLLRALGELDVRRREHVYWAARSAFLRRQDDLATFEALFERFWAGLALEPPGAPAAEFGETDPRQEGPQHGGSSLPQFRPDLGRAQLLDADGARVRSEAELPVAPGEEPGRGERHGVLAAYSPEEALTERTPLELRDDELAAVRRLAEELRAAAPLKRSRRLAAARRGRLDVRATIRRSLATGGEPLRPPYAGPARRPRRVLFLLDVSGSMERYARAQLASMQAAVTAGAKTEAFAFATRLTRLTGSLAGHDVARALEEARAAVPDWSGGTRIGHVLAEFRRTHGRLGLARGAIVIVASDGWDRGDPDLLAAELAALRLQCRLLVWIDPRPGDLAGQPLATGLRAALPYLDELVAGHDPRALEGLAAVLRGLGEARPSRSQRPRSTLARR